MKILSISCFFLFLFGTVSFAQDDIYNLDHVLEVKIYFEQDNWDAILDSLKQAGDNTRLVGDLIVDGHRYEGVGIRYKGNSSYFNVRKVGSSKLPFNIKLDYKDKKHELPGGYNKLKLANAFRDPSFLREVLSYEIARKYMPASRANFAKVHVNDTYLGLYHNTEAIEDNFLDRHYGEHKGTLVKCDPNWHAKTAEGCKHGDKASLMYLGKDSLCYQTYYELETKHGWHDLISLISTLHHRPDSLDKVLDIDQTLWMLAFNAAIVNLDSYSGRLCHNYYLYRDSTGAFHPIVWDMNLSFGGFRFTGLEGRPLSDEEMQGLSPFIHYKDRNEKRPLITKLLSDNLYRKIYVAHIKTILEENFANGEYLERAQRIQQMIDEYVKTDSNKLYTYEAFQENLQVSAKADRQSIVGIAELMKGRTDHIMNHPLFQKSAPNIGKISHFEVEDQLAITAEIEGAEKAWLFYRNQPVGLFSKIALSDSGENGDKTKQDGTWGVHIPFHPLTQYYIVAEGSATASLSPRRASFEFYTIEKTTMNE